MQLPCRRAQQRLVLRAEPRQRRRIPRLCRRQQRKLLLSLHLFDLFHSPSLLSNENRQPQPRRFGAHHFLRAPAKRQLQRVILKPPIRAAQPPL